MHHTTGIGAPNGLKFGFIGFLVLQNSQSLWVQIGAVGPFLSA